MLTYPWKCTVSHCNHLGNTWKPLVLMTRHFDYCPSASEGDNQSVRSSAPVVSRCFPGGYNVKLYISRGRLAWWLLAFLHSELASNSRKTVSNNVCNFFWYLESLEESFHFIHSKEHLVTHSEFWEVSNEAVSIHLVLFAEGDVLPEEIDRLEPMWLDALPFWWVVCTCLRKWVPIKSYSASRDNWWHSGRGWGM